MTSYQWMKPLRADYLVSCSCLNVRDYPLNLSYNLYKPSYSEDCAFWTYKIYPHREFTVIVVNTRDLTESLPRFVCRMRYQCESWLVCSQFDRLSHLHYSHRQGLFLNFCQRQLVDTDNEKHPILLFGIYIYIYSNEVIRIQSRGK